MSKIGEKTGFFTNPAVWEDKKPVLKRTDPFPGPAVLWEPMSCKKNHLQNFGSQAQLGRSSPNNSPPMLCKKTAAFWEPSPACQNLLWPPKKNCKILGAKPCLSDPANSLFMPCSPPPQQKITVTFWEPSPAWQSTKNKILREKKTLTKKIKLFLES